MQIRDLADSEIYHIRIFCFDFHAVYSATQYRAKLTHVYICVPEAHPGAYTNIIGVRITFKSLF
jgi:hypothetical protein